MLLSEHDYYLLIIFIIYYYTIIYLFINVSVGLLFTEINSSIYFTTTYLIFSVPFIYFSIFISNYSFTITSVYSVLLIYLLFISVLFTYLKTLQSAYCQKNDKLQFSAHFNITNLFTTLILPTHNRKSFDR